MERCGLVWLGNVWLKGLVGSGGVRFGKDKGMVKAIPFFMLTMFAIHPAK